MQRLRLSDELLHYLLLDDIQACGESALRLKGFDACSDYQDLGGHVYWEGYFHAEAHRLRHVCAPTEGEELREAGRSSATSCLSWGCSCSQLRVAGAAGGDSEFT